METIYFSAKIFSHKDVKLAISQAKAWVYTALGYIPLPQIFPRNLRNKLIFLYRKISFPVIEIST